MKERITWGWIDPHSRVLCSCINTSHPHWPWIWYHHHVFLLLFLSATYLRTCIIIHPFIFFHNPPATNPVHTYHTHTHTQQSIISLGWWKDNLSGLSLLSQQVRVVPVYVIVRMDWSTLLCPVPSYQYFPPPLSLDMISSSCLVVTLLSLVYHHTCIIIHPSICITTLNLQTHSTHTSPHTHNNELYILGDDKLLSHSSGCYLSRWVWSPWLWLWGWIDPHSSVLCHHINTSHLLGVGYDTIVMSSCYSSSAPWIILHALSSSIHPSAFQPSRYQPCPRTPHHTHTLMHALSSRPSIHLLEQVTPLSPTPQSRTTQDTHNNRLTYSHPLALDMISSMHYHVVSSHPSASFIKSPLCHQPPSPDPHNIHTTIN